jgi:hypothetical protein
MMLIEIKKKSSKNIKIKSLSFISSSMTIFIFLISFFISVVSPTQLRSSDFSSQYNVLFPNTTLLFSTFSTDYSYAQGGCKNDLNCFLPYGICLNATTCMCMPEYANIFVPGHSILELNCSYKKKKLVLAAVLEFFLPLGLGHFYVGQYFLGSLKFFYTFCLYTLCCFMYSKGFDHPTVTNSIVCCCLFACILPLWNLVDLLLFFLDVYRDGYGVPLV